MAMNLYERFESYEVKQRRMVPASDRKRYKDSTKAIDFEKH